jgi:hypothetical protein
MASNDGQYRDFQKRLLQHAADLRRQAIWGPRLVEDLVADLRHAAELIGLLETQRNRAELDRTTLERASTAEAARHEAEETDVRARLKDLEAGYQALERHRRG